VSIPALAGKRVTVMGLGLHGGGLATTTYLLEQGAIVTVTDLRSEDDLAPVLAQLPNSVRLVAGKHRMQDFEDADLVIKNPAVPRNVEYLAASSAVTTDIGLFLADWRGRLGSSAGPLVAITGTKGKSTTTAVMAHILSGAFPGTRMGGNITVSPLSFVNDLQPGDPVVLELSSFQLGDMLHCRQINPGTEVMLHPNLAPDVAMITSIYPDHQDYYHSMDAYVQDKHEVFHGISAAGIAIVGNQPQWVPVLSGAAYARGAEQVSIGGLPEYSASVQQAGEPVRYAIALAAAGCLHLGMSSQQIHQQISTFSGIPHRMELLGSDTTAIWFNDTAATIPEAALEAVQGLRKKHKTVVLIAGGSEKGLSLTPLVAAAQVVHESGGTTVLLAGSATDQLLPLLRQEKITVSGPHASITDAVAYAYRFCIALGNIAPPAVVLSPGCASFGMFKNEFDRGDQFRNEVKKLFPNASASPVA